jgi:hypothetical protein
MKDNNKNRSADECRAKASALRTISAHAHNPDAKSKMLAMALAWDARADEVESKARDTASPAQ